MSDNIFDDADALEQQFLAREQELLGDDANLFAESSAPSASATPAATAPALASVSSTASSVVTPAPRPSNVVTTAASPMQPPQPSSTASSTTGTAHTHAGPTDAELADGEARVVENELAAGFLPGGVSSPNGINDFGGNSTTASSALSQTPESDKIQQWRVQFQRRIADKDAKSRAKHDKILVEARQALERFYAEYNDKKAKTIGKNKEREDYEAKLRSGQGSVWESVRRHIEPTPGSTRAKPAAAEVKTPATDKRVGSSSFASPVTPAPGSSAPALPATQQKVFDRSRMREVIANLK